MDEIDILKVDVINFNIHFLFLDDIDYPLVISFAFQSYYRGCGVLV
jgi:hypothetical protein